MGEWKVYQRGDHYRIGKGTRGGPHWYEEVYGTFWETKFRETAFAKAKYMNTPKPALKWEVIDE